MSDSEKTLQSETTFIDKHRFSIMIVGAISIATILVLISIAIYYKSGAAQLDLSRPGYQAVRSQAITTDRGFQNYSATGPINHETITEFKTLYARQAKQIEAAKAFSGDPLDPVALGFTVVESN